MRVDIRAELAKEPVITDLGEIPNPAEFSTRYTPIYNQDGLNLEFAPDCQDYSAIPPQFLPSVQMANDNQRQREKSGLWMYIQIRQGLLKPDQKNFFGSMLHTDGIYSDCTWTKQTPLVKIRIVSDKLQPVILKQAFDTSRLPSYITPEEYNVVLARLFNEQAKEENKHIARAYHMTDFGPCVGHGGQKIKEQTQRTLLTARFTTVPTPSLFLIPVRK